MNATVANRPASPAGTALHDWSGLSVEREDIAFSSPKPGLLAVELTITNSGPHPTTPTFGVLQSAPLGAFVPWQPLDVVQVPALEPGESVVVTKEYAVDPPQVIGSADKIPPDRLLVALGLGEPDRRRSRRRVLPTTPPAVAPDVMGALGLGGLYWAGNLNLFFPHRDVERHAAQALRIYPGLTNLAMFVVGSGNTDEYRFAFSGDGTAWNPRIFDNPAAVPIVRGAKQSDALKEGEWHRPLTGLFTLMVQPPEKAERGAVNVHVCQKSSGREAVVEFTMDARAAGPGCYKV